MRPTTTIALAFALLAGCGHAKTTEKPGDNEGPSSMTPAEPAHHEAPAAHPNETPVVEQPESLLAPGAEDDIRAKLKDAGFLDGESKSLERAVRKFQAAHDLPVTGVVDHETARKLGLDPAKVFRHAEPKP
ncbi:MAG TPA: peptidoglycan-binding domain-containing protein [Polyangia bacterium]|nr:peptidoglycan-binding domain-containing protein [Polyangia bacterium]